MCDVRTRFSLLIFSVSDDILDSWFLVSTPWPVVFICTVYLFLVLKIGPDFMKERNPYSLKMSMMFYNIFQVVYNGWLVLWVRSFLRKCLKETYSQLHKTFVIVWKYKQQFFFWLCLQLLTHDTALPYMWNHSCHPLDPSKNPLRLEVSVCRYWVKLRIYARRLY